MNSCRVEQRHVGVVRLDDAVGAAAALEQVVPFRPGQRVVALAAEDDVVARSRR